MLSTLRNGLGPYVMGHRGAKGRAPENTMAAFRKGVELGADLLECDVHLTQDGEAVVFHDDTVDRAIGLPPRSGRVVSEFTLPEIQNLKVFGNERVPSLDELLGWLKNEASGIALAIEIKQGARVFPELLEEVISLVRAQGLEDRIIVTSFFPEAIREAMRRAPELASGLIYGSKPADPIVVAETIGADALWPSLALTSPEFVEQAHEAGLGVFTWTANTPQTIRAALSAKVDAIGTDFPDLAREIVDETRRLVA